MEIQQKCSETFRQQLDTLFRENSELIYRAAYHVLRHHQDAEEVLQNVFVRLITRGIPDNFRNNPKGYLHKSAVNDALDLIRQRKSRRPSDQRVEGLEIPVPAPDSNTDDRIDRMRLALIQMKPRFVETLNLAYKEGLSCAEIAKIQGRSSATVFSDLCRARYNLKQLINQQEDHREIK